MTRSFLASFKLLCTRGYLLGGLGSVIGLGFLSVMLNVGEPEATVEQRGPLGDSITLDQLNSADGLALAMGGTIGLVGMVVLAIHASAIATDFSTGTLRNLLVRQPSRWRLMGGRSLALLAATLVAVCALAATTVATGLLFAPTDVDTSNWFTSDGWAELARATGNVALAALGWGLLGQVLAVLSRSAVVSLAVGVAIAIPIDMVVSDGVESAAPYLPGQLFQAISRGGSSVVAYDRALLTVAVGVILTAAASLTLFHRRDVTA